MTGPESSPTTSASAWPPLDGEAREETSRSLLLWGQILGKTRLALAPMMNHWWQVPFYVTARGLTTSPMPTGDWILDVELDFIDHRLVARTSDGGLETMRLCDQPLCGFYAGYEACLARLGVGLSIHPVAVELPERVVLDRTSACAATIPSGQIGSFGRSSRPIGC